MSRYIQFYCESMLLVLTRSSSYAATIALLSLLLITTTYSQYHHRYCLNYFLLPVLQVPMLRRAAATATATKILTPRNIFYTTAAASTATTTTFNGRPKYMATACDNLTYLYTAVHTLLLDCHWAFQTLVTESSAADKTSCPYTVNERYFHIYSQIHTCIQYRRL